MVVDPFLPLEIKREVNELLKPLGKNPKYTI